jgi:hypothetical protein
VAALAGSTATAVPASSVTSATADLNALIMVIPFSRDRATSVNVEALRHRIEKQGKNVSPDFGHRIRIESMK